MLNDVTKDIFNFLEDEMGLKLKKRRKMCAPYVKPAHIFCYDQKLGNTNIFLRFEWPQYRSWPRAATAKHVVNILTSNDAHTLPGKLIARTRSDIYEINSGKKGRQRPSGELDTDLLDTFLAGSLPNIKISRPQLSESATNTPA